MEETKTDPGKGIIKALGEFQQLCPAIKKDSSANVTTKKGDKYSYKYGSLPHVLEVIKPHLKKTELMYTQPIVYRDGLTFLYTTVYHIPTGEKIESKMLIPDVEFIGMNVFQSLGSGITYLRRYTLMAILGIVAEEDDNDAQGKAKPKGDKKAQTDVQEKPWLNPETGGMLNPTWAEAVRYLSQDGTMESIKGKYRISKVNEEKLKNEALEYVDGFNNQEKPKENE
jgi:hypothetical protein